MSDSYRNINTSNDNRMTLWGIDDVESFWFCQELELLSASEKSRLEEASRLKVFHWLWSDIDWVYV